VVLFSYAAIYLIWGSTFLAIRVGLETIPPLAMMGIRCTAAGLLLVAAAQFHGERTSIRGWGHALVAGALMFAVCYGALAWAEERLASGITALFVATLPFWMTMIEWGQSRQRPSPRIVAGLVVGLAGVGLLVWRGVPASPFALAPAAALIGGELAWAAGALYGKTRLPESLMLGAGMPLTTGGLLLLGSAWIGGELSHFSITAVSSASIAATAYLTIFGSIVAFSAYQWLLRIEPASRVGTHAYVNPLIAVALGATLGGEPMTIGIAAAALVIAAGVAIVVGAESEPAPRPTQVPFREPRIWRSLREAAIVDEGSAR